VNSNNEYITLSKCFHFRIYWESDFLGLIIQTNGENLLPSSCSKSATVKLVWRQTINRENVYFSIWLIYKLAQRKLKQLIINTTTLAISWL